MKLNKAFLLDLAERVGWTYVQTFVGLLALNQTNLFTVDPYKAAAVAAAPAALAVIKGAFKEALVAKPAVPVMDDGAGL